MRCVFLTSALVTGLAAQGAKPAPVLEGLVTDTLGDGIPAATIEAFVDGKRVARAVADGEGIYQLTRLPEAGAELRFTARGKVEHRSAWRHPTSPRVANVVLEDAARLHGVICDEHGARVAGAAVVVVAGLHQSEARTDADGAYLLPAVALRPAIVRVSGPSGWAERRVRMVADTRLDLTLTVRDARLVRVFGLPAAASATATLQVWSSDLALLPDRGRVPLRDDATAELRLTQPSLVCFHAAGFDSDPGQRHVMGGQAPIDFAAHPVTDRRTTVRGQVRAGNNRPVVGLGVVVRDRSNCDLATTQLDEHGRFRVRLPLPADAFLRLGLELRDFHLVGSEVVFRDGFSWIQHPCTGGEEAQFVADRLGVVQATLLSASGAQLAFAEVVGADPDQAHRTLVHTSSDRAGRIELAVPPGRHELLATAPDGSMAAALVELRYGQATVVGDWRTVPSGEVHGQLLGATGQPVPGVDLFLASTLLQEGCGSAARRLSARVVTDRHGRFRCRGLEPGIWTVVGLKSEVEEAAVDIRAGAAAGLPLRAR